MKTVLAIVVAASVAAAAVLLGVYLPARTRLLEAQAALVDAEASLAEARSLLEVHALSDGVLDLLDEAQDPARHEKALAMSTRFFDLVRAEVGRTASAEVRTALSEVLARRDVVTASLARRDPAVRATLDEIRGSLHPLLREQGARSAAMSPTAVPPEAPAGPAAPTGPAAAPTQ